MQGRLPVATARAPAVLQPMIAEVSYSAFLWAVVVATVIPAAVVAVATLRSEARWAHWAAATVQAVVAVNVLSHLASVTVLGGYAPGVVTAILLNLPFSTYFFRRASRERWFARGALWATVPAALLIHGPGLFGILALSVRLARVGRL